MPQTQTLANRMIEGDVSAASCIRGIIRLKSNNLIERPWGGLRMLNYKSCAPLPDQKRITGLGIGEAFEVAACPSDPESNAYPSMVCLPDGSRIALPQLLDIAGREILGGSLYEQFAGEIPLLPKTLDIEELLSVQAHPPGNTELYVIIDAEPGASIRLGFRHNVDPDLLREELSAGRRRQEQLLNLLHDNVDQNKLQDILAPALADRDGDLHETMVAMQPLVASGSESDAIFQNLGKLKALYWHVLDMMNEVMVKPGQIIYNATPARVCTATGNAPSAEVHALGNPERREVLMLEIRRPGVTYRAWDNVRFPIREINIDQTVNALHLGATSPAEFEVTPRALPDTPGLFRSVSDDCFVVDHIRPGKNKAVPVTGGYFHTLHAIRGCVSLTDDSGNTTTLAAGESAIAPATLRAYRVTTDTSAELIGVSLPAS